MALTPIVQIPVDDSEFQKFSELFSGWREKVKEMPEDWAAMNKRIAEAAALQRSMGATADAAWKNATSAAMNYERAVAKASSAQGNLGKSATAAAHAMKGIASTVHTISSGVFGITRSLTKWATFGLGGGLLGLGGLTFGLDSLAHGVLEKQRLSRGLGMSTGQYNAFASFMSPYAGTGILQSASAAKMNLPAAAGQLANLGITMAEAKQDTPAQLADQIMLSVRRTFRQNPSGFGLTAQAAAAQYFGLSTADIYNVGTSNGAALRAAMRNATTNTAALGFSATAQKEWTQFSVQLRKAGILIETALINTLTPLTPQLTRLSKEIADFIVGLEKSGEVKHWVADLADAIKRFTAWLGSPSFQQDMQTFARDFHIVAEAVYRVAKGVVGLVGDADKLAHGKPAGFMLGAKNNPGDVMIPGTHTIAHYDTLSQGISAAYNDLSGMPKTYGTTTVGAALAKYKGPWAGPDDMTTQQYVDFVTSNAGISPNAPLPIGNTKAMERIMYGLFEAEGWPITMGEIRTSVEHKPGTRASPPTLAVPPSVSIAPPHRATEKPTGQSISDLEDRWTRVYARHLMSKLPATSNIGLVRDRYWATHSGVKVKVQNSTSAQVHVSANAATIP